ncbi:MAG: regulatory protein RecX, partial [Bdellovibrio sp.]
MFEDKKPKNSRQAAKKKVMDLLARRDHSEKELRKKLLEKFA